MSTTPMTPHTSALPDALSIHGAAFANVPTPTNSFSEPVIIVSSDEPVELIIPASACTHEGFRHWALSDEYPARGKLSYIGGVVFLNMSPESFEEQGAIKAEVSRVLLQIVRERGIGHFRIDRTLISNQEARLSSEPDAIFVSRASLGSGRVKLVPGIGRPRSSKELVGSVDWVMEIVSPGSRNKDYEVLRDAYYKSGISEYWLIDPLVEDDEQVRFQILVPGPAGYLEVETENSWLASPTFGCSFRLTRERDEDGFWEYTLHVQEKS
jgi:Uma2 family endonuclease